MSNLVPKTTTTLQFPELLREHERATQTKFQQLDKRILTESAQLQRQLDATSAQYEKRLDAHLQAQTEELKVLNRAHTQITEDYTSKIAIVKDSVTTLSSSIQNVANRIDKFNIEESALRNGDTQVKIRDLNGATHVLRIPKQEPCALPDNKMLRFNDYHQLTLCDIFDPTTIQFKNNIYSPTGLRIPDGPLLTGATIKSKLDTTEKKIQEVSEQVTTMLSKLSDIGVCEFTTNFETVAPTNQQLNMFVLSQLFTSKDAIPHGFMLPGGIRVINLFDNHVWVHNKIVSDGLTISRWDDLGADTRHIATNSGTLGNVCGSLEKYRGFVNLQGVISINGLEETFAQILKSITNLQTDFTRFRSEVSAKLSKYNIN